MLLRCSAHEYGVLVTLSTGHKVHKAIARHLVSLLACNDCLFLVGEESGLVGEFNVGLHRAAFDNNLLVMLVSELNDANDTFKNRSERCNDDTTTCIHNELLNVLMHHWLRNRVTCLLAVRRV